MLDGNTLDPAGKINLPVGLVTGNRIDSSTFIRRKITIPAQFLEHAHGEFRIAVLDFRPYRIRTFGQEVIAFVFNPETGTEAQSAFSNRLVGVIEQRCARMPHFSRPPARPGKTVIFTIKRAANSLQRGPVKSMLILHMGLHTFRRLAGIADGPHTLVELTRDIFDQRLIVVDRNIAEHAVSKAQFLGELVDDRVVRQ